jgi:hypothetical protein
MQDIRCSVIEVLWPERIQVIKVFIEPVTRKDPNDYSVYRVLWPERIHMITVFIEFCGQKGYKWLEC